MVLDDFVDWASEERHFHAVSATNAGNQKL
jgi:hypothetical protein